MTGVFFVGCALVIIACVIYLIGGNGTGRWW
jgi:hypothetical protein